MCNMRLEAVQCYGVLQHHCLSEFVTAQEHVLNWLCILLTLLIGIHCLQAYVYMHLWIFISLYVCKFIYVLKKNHSFMGLLIFCLSLQFSYELAAVQQQMRIITLFVYVFVVCP